MRSPSSAIAIHAGPGTGKTAVLVARAAFLVEQGVVHQDEILALTFTRAAASSLAERMVEAGLPSVRVSTLMAWGLWILGRLHDYSGVPPGALLLGESDGDAVTASVARTIGIKPPRRKSDVEAWLRVLHARVARRLSNAMAAEGVLSYHEVEQRLLALLEHNPVFRGVVGRMHRALLVDEAQDLSDVQWSILHAWRPEWITLVGDVGQSIYEWRDARPARWLEHLRDGSHATWLLTRNYRAASSLVDTANDLAAKIAPDTPPQVSASGEVGEIHVASTMSAALAFLRTSGAERDSIAFLGRTHLSVDRAAEWLDGAGVEVRTAASRNRESAELRRLRRLCILTCVPTADSVCHCVFERPTWELATAVRQQGVTGGALVWHTTFGPAIKRAMAVAPESASEAIRILREHIPRADELLSCVEWLAWAEDWERKEKAAGRATSLRAWLCASADRAQADDMPADESPVCCTIHAAKGREWNTVVLLDATEGTHPLETETTTVENRLYESRRLFYVGITRARRRLVLLVPEGGILSRFAVEAGFGSRWR